MTYWTEDHLVAEQQWCPYCAVQGQEQRRETGPSAQIVSIDAGNTAPLEGTLCRGCREEIGADLAAGPAPAEI